MTIKYNSELSGISKALESYINLAERMNTEQLVQASKAVLSTQQLISKFNDLNVTGAIAGLKTISDKLQTINLSSTVDSINRNSATSVVQKIIEANKTIYDSFLEDYSENESEYVSNEVSQTANEVVSDLENLSKHLGEDAIEIPSKKSKWTERQIRIFYSCLIPVMIAIVQMIQAHIYHQEDMAQAERHHQENIELQRQTLDDPVEFSQDFIEILKNISVGINKLADSITVSSNDVPDSVVTNEINNTDENETE